MKKSSEIKMEVTSDNVVVEVEKKFYLDMPLPYEVNETSGSAKFDKAKQTLTLELPVVPKMPKPEALAAARRLQGHLVADEGGLEDEAPEDEVEEGKPQETQEPPESEELVQETEPQDAADEVPVDVPAEPSRPLLELDGSASALRIAEAPGVEEMPEEMGVEEMEDQTDERPTFMAAETFEGTREGYYFARGDEGPEFV